MAYDRPDPRRRPGYRRYYDIRDRERFGLTWEAEPPAPGQEVELGGLVPSILKSMGLEQDLWQKQLFEEWVSLVGPQVAKNARPGQVDRGILSVYVTSSAWLNELSRFGKPQMLKKLQAQFGAHRIRAVRLQLDPDLNR
jgi:hypothetical protein